MIKIKHTTGSLTYNPNKHSHEDNITVLSLINIIQGYAHNYERGGSEGIDVEGLDYVTCDDEGYDEALYEVGKYAEQRLRCLLTMNQSDTGE